MKIYAWESEGTGYQARSRGTVRPPELFDDSELKLTWSYKGTNHYNARHKASGKFQLFIVEYDGYREDAARAMLEGTPMEEAWIQQDEAELAALATAK